jgi:MFS family permease
MTPARDGPQDPPAPSASLVAHALRALRHRNFRLFTIGQTTSLIGTWMQQVAVGWLVYRLTDSAFLLGLVAFVSQAPSFFLSPIAGVIADRYDKRRIVLITQSIMMAQASALAILVLTGHITVGLIIALMTVLGAATGFDIPARQSFIIEMIGDKEDLPSAIALNSSMFNASRLVGPAVAGLLVAAVGEGLCILLNAASYTAVLAALLAMRLPARSASAARLDVIRHFSEGVRYAWNFRPIRSILALVAFTSFVGVPFSVLLPVVANDVLGGGAATLGFLSSAVGLGALSGALFLASRRSVRGLGTVITRAAATFGVALLVIALSRSLWITLPLLTLAGFGMMAQMASANTVLQTLVADDKRGRIMSLYSMSFTGVSPFGSLAGGAVASALGAPAAFALGGTGCLLAAAVFGGRVPALREVVRPLYQRLGILPEVARGIQAVTHETNPPTLGPGRNDVQP